MCKTMSCVLTAAMIVGLAMPSSSVAAAKKVPKLSNKKISIKVGEKKTIKVKNATKKVKWSVKSGKKYVTLSGMKKTSAVVKGKKAGSAVVTAKIGKTTLSCKVTVSKKAVKVTPKPDATQTVAPTAGPTVEPSAEPSQPAATEKPGAAKPTPKPTIAPEFESSEFVYDGLDKNWIQENIDPSKPVVAMSFDDGPGEYNGFVDYGMQIQKALKDAGAHATFFYIGAHIARNEETRKEVEEAWKAGFEVANHSYDSNGLNGADADTVKEKIDKTDELLSEITGYKNFLFRAPNVAYSATMYAVIEKPFIDVSIWSNDYQTSVEKDAIVKNVTEKLADGGIINMHSVHEKTAQAVPEILAYCKENGYQVVSVSELFAIKGKKLMTGVKYSDAN